MPQKLLQRLSPRRILDCVTLYLDARLSTPPWTHEQHARQRTDGWSFEVHRMIFGMLRVWLVLQG